MSSDALDSLTPSLEQVKIIAGLPGNKGKTLIPVYAELLADMETPVSAFLKLREGSHSFLLESVTGGENVSRYSFIGSNPLKVLRIDDRDPLIDLEEELSKLQSVRDTGDLTLNLPPFAGGAIGYLSYDTVRHFEPRTAPFINKQKDVLKIPESVWMLCDTIVSFDHVTHSMKVISHCRTDTGDLEESYKAAVKKVLRSVARLQGSLPASSVQVPLRAPTNTTKEVSVDWKTMSNVGKEGYEGFVHKLQSHIVSGDIIQAVPSQRLTVPLPEGVTPFDLYRQLRIVNPSPYMYYVEIEGTHIVGASPEMLVKVDENQIVQTHPIAGTRRRGKTPAEDKNLAEELLADQKERAEHIMLVDLGRNDVGRVAAPGTVHVESLMHIEKYSHVMHIVSVVKGKLDPSKTAFDAVRSIFPAGTVSGAPKVKAMELVAQCETEKRGIYAGAVGYVGFGGVIDTAIAIRTMVIKDGIAYLQAGGGITYDSVPHDEYIETVNKLGGTVRALEQTKSRVKSQVGVATAGANAAPKAKRQKVGE